MKKEYIEQCRYVIEPDEVGTISMCLDYCYHRLVKHSDSGIAGFVNLDKINKMREALGTGIKKRSALKRKKEHKNYGWIYTR